MGGGDLAVRGVYSSVIPYTVEEKFYPFGEEFRSKLKKKKKIKNQFCKGMREGKGRERKEKGTGNDMKGEEKRREGKGEGEEKGKENDN